MANNPKENPPDAWPQPNKALLFMGLAMLILLIATNVLVIIRVDHVQLGLTQFGPYSIHASKKMWIAYHVWGIIAASGVIATWVMKQRLLFLVFLLLLVILMFYPYFTA